MESSIKRLQNKVTELGKLWHKRFRARQLNVAWSLFNLFAVFGKVAFKSQIPENIASALKNRRTAVRLGCSPASFN
jgi:hypothetical protein